MCTVVAFHRYLGSDFFIYSAQWSYKFVKHAFKVEKLLFIQVTSTFTTYKALFGEHGTSVQT